MIDVVFSGSAMGSLMQARRSVKSNGVYGFNLALSVGDISADLPGLARHRVLCDLCHFSLSLPSIMEQIDKYIEDALPQLKAVLERSASGEAVRIWYSDQPDEMCGLYWILAQLDSAQCGPISMIKLPYYTQQDDKTLVYRNQWGEVSQDEWHTFLPLEQKIPASLRKALAAKWRTLQGENAPLRAVVNGSLMSVPENLYDGAIRRELESIPSEFQEGALIESILCHCQLGISDGVISNRIEAMVKSGELEVAAQAPDDRPTYARILRKL